MYCQIQSIRNVFNVHKISNSYQFSSGSHSCMMMYEYNFLRKTVPTNIYKYIFRIPPGEKNNREYDFYL